MIQYIAPLGPCIEIDTTELTAATTFTVGAAIAATVLLGLLPNLWYGLVGRPDIWQRLTGQ